METNEKNLEVEEPLWPTGFTLDRRTNRLVDNSIVRTGNNGKLEGKGIWFEDNTEAEILNRDYEDEDGPLYPTGFRPCSDC
jgi:hypothetical protein